MNGFGFSRYGGTPPVVKNLIYINAILLIATWVLDTRFNYDLTQKLGLFYFESSYFRTYQFITHMFMHGGFTHLLFNMFALWMFGKVLESVWGSRRFLMYYMITGLGAAAFQTLVNYIHFAQIHSAILAFSNSPSPDLFATIISKYFSFLGQIDPGFITDWTSHASDPMYAQAALDQLNVFYTKLINVPTIGASGAVFGVLLAFGMLFPNTELMLLFPPIPIKAKWAVIGYGTIELFLGVTQTNSNIAHFAHLGGMIFGFFLIKYWNKNRTTFY